MQIENVDRALQDTLAVLVAVAVTAAGIRPNVNLTERSLKITVPVTAIARGVLSMLMDVYYATTTSSPPPPPSSAAAAAASPTRGAPSLNSLPAAHRDAVVAALHDLVR